MDSAARSILIVDDVPDSLDRLREAFAGRGYRIRTARSGAEALSELRSEPADLLVLDQVLPDFAAAAVCSAVRDRASTRRMPILLLSSPGLEEDASRCRAAGANAILRRPWEAGPLLQATSHLLGAPPRRTWEDLAAVRPEGAPEPHWARTVNISAGGILLVTGARLEIGQSLDLLLYLPEETEALLLRGLVVRTARETDEANPAFGIAFVGIGDSEKGRLARFASGGDPSGRPAGAGH